MLNILIDGFIILFIVFIIFSMFIAFYPKILINGIKQKKFIFMVLVFVFFSLCCSICYMFFEKNRLLKEAEQLEYKGNYYLASMIYTSIGEYDKAIYMKYQYAIQLYNSNKYAEAKEIFESIYNYKDVYVYLENISNMKSFELATSTYSIAWSWYNNGEFKKAVECFSSIVDYKDSQDLTNRLINAHSITVGVRAAVAIIDNGNVKHANNEYNFSYSSWKDIVSVAFAEKCVIGLKIDGTVVTKGNFVKKAEQDWDDIIAVTAGVKHVVGLKSDGSVVADGINSHGQCDVGTWKNIVAVAAGWYHTVGLDKYGNVFIVGNNSEQQNEEMTQNKSEWTNIVAIAAGGGDKNNDGKGHTVGLRADGTVVAVGDNYYNQREVNEWTDIVAIAAGEWHTVGLKADGTVVTTRPDQNIIDKDEKFGLACKVDDWTDVAEIAAGCGLTVGLKKDGTVLVAGYNNAGQRDSISQIGKVPPRQHLFDDFVK